MLILGSRYGSIEPDSGKSYTQLEYEYALNTGKRLFAVVLTEPAIEKKIKSQGLVATEHTHPNELADFKKVVTSKICRMVDDAKDIKLAIHETLLDFLREYSFDGWVSGKHVAEMEEMSRELAGLTRENTDLRAALQSRKVQPTLSAPDKDEDFEVLIRLLGNEKIVYQQEGKEAIHISAIDWFYNHKEEFVAGISNTYDMSEFFSFLYFRVSPLLAIHGLTEDQKVTGAKWRTVKTTKKGNTLLAYLQKRLAASKQKKGSATGEKPSTRPPPDNSSKNSQADAVPNGQANAAGAVGLNSTTGK
jgi:alpha/beta superfamily hydrolase